MFNKTRLLTATIAAALLMSACGGSAEPTITAVDNAAAQAESSVQVADAAPAVESQQTGTLTLSDGTVIDLVVGDCKTKSTHSSSFLIDNGFDVSGNSVDDFYHFGALKASATGDPAPLVDLTGDRDENRVNPKIDYINIGTDADVPTTLVADGGRVYGEVVLRDFHSTTPVFGETITAQVEFNCG